VSGIWRSVHFGLPTVGVIAIRAARRACEALPQRPGIGPGVSFIGVTSLEPTLTVELTYSEVMEDRLRDPVYRGLA